MPETLPGPRLEKLCKWLAPPTLREYVLGDLAEEWGERGKQSSRIRLHLWYVGQWLRSTPSFLTEYYRCWRRNLLMQTLFATREQKMAWLGLVLYIPAIILVSSGLLFSLGLPTLSLWVDPLIDTVGNPIIVLGGLFGGFLLALLPIFRFSLRNQEGELVSTVRLKLSWLNLLIVTLSLLMAAVIFVYLLAENFGIFATLRG